MDNIKIISQKEFDKLCEENAIHEKYEAFLKTSLQHELPKELFFNWGQAVDKKAFSKWLKNERSSLILLVDEITSNSIVKLEDSSVCVVPQIYYVNRLLQAI